MGVGYVKSIHGLFSVVQAVLLVFAIGAACLVWSDVEVYFLLFRALTPLMTVVLVVFLLAWLIAVFVLVNEVIGNDVLEGLGKLKVLIVHGVCGLFLIAAGVISTIYYFQSDNSDAYATRLLCVMISAWICVISYIIQFILVFLQ